MPVRWHLLPTQRLMFYRERYENHLDSLKFAEEQLARADAKLLALAAEGRAHASDNFLVSYVRYSPCFLPVACDYAAVWSSATLDVRGAMPRCVLPLL